MESFFASLETEHVHLARFRTREEAKAAVFDYIEVFYCSASTFMSGTDNQDGRCWPVRLVV
jgi:hypothetical protein